MVGIAEAAGGPCDAPRDAPRDLADHHWRPTPGRTVCSVIARVRGLCSLFTTSGEAYLDVMLGASVESGAQLVRQILANAQHPEREVAEITFPFWNTLGKKIYL